MMNLDYIITSNPTLIWCGVCTLWWGQMGTVSAVVSFVSPQHAQLVLQVCDAFDQSGSVGLSPLVGLPASLLHLPLVPALHLGGHRFEEVLSHLHGVHVVPLLSEGGLLGLVSEHLQDPGPCGSFGFAPGLGELFMAPPSVPAPLPVSEPSLSAAAAVLRAWRQAAGSLASTRTVVHYVQFLQVLGLPLGVGTDHWTLLGPDHLDR